MNRTVPGVFAERVARAPDAVAVSCGDRRLSYAELDAWAGDVARRLAARGVRPGNRVGVAVRRSADLVAALLGVLTAGAAYVPVEVGDPFRRRAALLADAGVTVLLADEAAEKEVERHGLPVVPAARRRAAGAAPGATAGPSDPAYLLYTSGSTGEPKAVVVEHHSIVNLVVDPGYVRITPADRVLHLAPVAFDAATFEIWAPLLNGARLVVAPPGPPLAEEIENLVHEQGITVLWLTAALFHRQIDERPDTFRGGLRTVIAGGDVLSPGHVGRLLAHAPGLAVVNGYGPTEATTFACTHRVTAADVAPGPIPIGRPIRDVTAEVRDAAGRPVADGVTGELWIGGEGVARGYWRRPALTAAAFVRDPADGAVRYRTGDLARRRSDGVLEFLGRADGQFKLRGYRVEPGEIESALAGHPAVREAAVAVRANQHGDPRLVAYVVPRGPEPVDRRGLRDHLSDRLPRHLVPAVFVVVARLPLTTNGKVDRGALPTPRWQRKDTYV
ncbi:amino acid adenylation domain-containing protein [Amorphoplanes digitatis]|uniref:Amino acid adenylation domain-containing protein n=1 Tax=Actinoplanes digitatis TaxID=1868 RepID=A0A7W7HW68_9ACTN|nr:amino acid adenylation domain-containing protein [Actinoplanes digitatis]MBB4761838.1 amino acid adenylation domain-containing protein [Actinoplanes digitatis]GID90949.1 hypothetical protein Adi01nite_03610 [Actinoplanes digitatis]